ncbi:Retrovirus-related Pol polyprotein from type-2 retrotransposable element R2DM [Symbiodinium microadriaticum]|uniref:Retrovirus-related Pol polyprotein from type-2 retrotransposable element R2DM n=1 Tax=Symbiodinium microadriaticum TaxID=2951 RepID=A0A1Q9F197_SYMMI|nr:Retrovirus-related Pol polyprotein from type-2 retrotransposable element R2DM [Symbiodinium microadriaticum]CAE7824475.1 pol [Symbiodinium sp. KB8]
MDEMSTQNAPTQPLEMQVDLERSPTEVADESDIGDDPFGEPGTEAGEAPVKIEKRKREKKKRCNGDGLALAVPVNDDSDLESPTKRPSCSEERPLTAKELRELLMGHVSEMKSAWSSFHGRLEKVEHDQRRSGELHGELQSRTVVVEKELAQQRLATNENKVSLESLTNEVKQMKVRLEEVGSAAAASSSCQAAGQAAPQNPSDPWAEFLRRKGAAKAPDGVKATALPPEVDRGDVLTEDEKRTLVFGGWLQDTRKATIDEESGVILALPEIKEHVDAEKLTIYGPRRSVGMLKFTLRAEESEQSLKERMWKVVRVIAGLKHVLPSTRDGNDSRTMWASFVKTRNARLRSSHVSMVRRVTIALAKDAFSEQAGGVCQGLNLQVTAYDVDWNMGTIWCGTRKLASASHRAPRDEEVVTMRQNLPSNVSFDKTKECRGDLPPPCAKHKWGRIGHWNLGGQKLDMLDVICKDLDILLVQEVSRGNVGWSEFDRDEFHWVVHRDADQWRGVAVGIALDRFDSTIKKIRTKRGIWVVYQAAVDEFFAACPRKFRHLPLVCGVDANEVPHWKPTDTERLEIDNCGANFNTLLHDSMHIGILPLPPEPVFKNAWTHFPRDETRSGRQIDVILRRHLHLSDVIIDADRRHALGTDHALLSTVLWTARGPTRTKWSSDSRARWVYSEPVHRDIVDEEDLIEIAKECSRPRFPQSFKDDAETFEAIGAARFSNAKQDWKKVQRIRREKRKQWQTQRLSSILTGNWEAYRQLQQEKKRRRGWWGDLLEDRSAAQLAGEIEDHLRSKMMSGSDPSRWDSRLDELLAACPRGTAFQPFQLHEVATELQSMRCRSAVGPDGIGVHLLRELVSHPSLGNELLGLINHIVETQQLPTSWSRSFLALIAKVPSPKKPSDLRPIQVSSAFNKLVNKLVCSRVLPHMRSGSKISCCGKGRQSADLVGCVGRMRDICREWRHPMLLGKLDVSGAFDKIDRGRVAKFMIDKLSGRDLPNELRYMLEQLRSHNVSGTAPGGVDIALRPDVGIKQGAPESAEIFAMIMDSLLSDLVRCQQWKDMGQGFDGADIDVLLYQDDIFLIDTDMNRLCRRIKIIDRCLSRVGLSLATSKTKIVANEFYTGPRRVQVNGDTFQLAERGDSLKVLGLSFSLSQDPSEQAQEVIARARAAAASHSDILNAPGPWKAKVGIARTLVESQFNWIGGALHWGQSSLHALNTLQLQILRTAFGLKRYGGESWVDWNKRSLRLVRLWLHSNDCPRWSTRILTLQHMLHGHWARRLEYVDSTPTACPPMRALMWRGFTRVTLNVSSRKLMEQIGLLQHWIVMLGSVNVMPTSVNGMFGGPLDVSFLFGAEASLPL